MSPKVWNELVWPYFKRAAEMVIEEGVVPVYHLDSNRIKGLERFKELPKHSAIMSLDGTTDIRQARKIMGDHTAILGDVEAALMAFGTPEEVEGYAKKLIHDFSDGGYLVAVGCDTPLNARPENMEALIRAGHEK